MQKRSLLLTALLVIFSAFQVLAQELDLYIEQPEFKVLYRGYPNKIYVKKQGTNYLGDVRLELSGVNCEIVEGDKSGEYIVKPGSGRKATITVYKKEGDVTLRMIVSEFMVSNFPEPTLYWGGAKSGVTGSPKSLTIRAKYLPEIPLHVTFEITAWTLTCNGKSITGTGEDLSDAAQLLEEIKTPTTVAITATVVGIDGISRSVGGAWPSIPYPE